MSSKPKILFVYDHPNPDMWQDGLSAALTVLEKDFEIERCSMHFSGPPHLDFTKFDFILGWGGFNSPVDKYLQTPERKSGKIGLCIAGNAFPPDGCTNYNVLFYETKWYRDQIKHHPNIVQAFGVNTDIFFNQSEDYPTPIIWDYIGVGALADWKRWEKMLDMKGSRLIVGEYQLGNEAESLAIAKSLLKGGVAVSPTVNPVDLASLYNYSRILYMPSTIYGGGERAVLEARACGLEVIIEPDNDKLKELLDCPIPTHLDYAEKLKKGILSVL